MANRNDWVSLLSSEVGRGIYVWGGNGEVLDTMTDPETWIRKRETNEQNAMRAINLYRKRKAAGISPIRAFDCSGLMHWALQSLHILEQDVSSRGLYAKCESLNSVEELRTGDFVFRHDGERIVHVAYIGSRVIECIGRDEGVVATELKRRNWNRYGRLKALERVLDQVGDVTAEQSNASAAAERDRAAFVVIRGRSVRIRNGGSTAYKTLCIAHAGERYPLLGIAETGWYRIELPEGEGYITSAPRYTEVSYA